MLKHYHHRTNTLEQACAAAMVAFAAVFVQSAESRAADMVSYEVIDEVSIPQPLTATPGNPDTGRKVAINRKKGNCLACHVMPIPEQPYHGKTGTDLNGVGSRYELGELRLRVVDPKVLNPETMMPSFYRVQGLNRVSKKFQGKPILSAQEVEDVIAYLATLKETE